MCCPMTDYLISSKAVVMSPSRLHRAVRLGCGPDMDGPEGLPLFIEHRIRTSKVTSRWVGDDTMFCPRGGTRTQVLPP